MPHKDRSTYLAYLDGYRARHRPAPEVEPQRDGLPPIGAVEFSDDGERVRCHACGRWFKALNTHLRMHDLDAETYKERYGLKRTASLWPPALVEKQRQAALDRDQGSVGRECLPRDSRRPVGLSARLQHRIEASDARRGVNTRAGQRIKHHDR